MELTFEDAPFESLFDLLNVRYGMTATENKYETKTEDNRQKTRAGTRTRTRTSTRTTKMTGD